MTHAALAQEYESKPVSLVQIDLDAVAGTEQDAETFLFYSNDVSEILTSSTAQARPYLLTAIRRGQEIKPSVTTLDRATLEFLDDQEDVSTFWRKWIARNRVYPNRVVQIFSGFTNEPIADYRLEFKGLIDNIAFKPDGNVVMDVRSILQITDVNIPAEAIANTSVTLAVGGGSMTVSNPDALLNFPSSGTLKIGQDPGELIDYSALSITTGIITLSTRGVLTSLGYAVDSEWAVNSNVRLVEKIDGTNIIDVMQNLLTDAGVAIGDINTTSFTDIKTQFFPTNTVQSVIERPVSVQKHLQELREVTFTYLAVDENYQVKLYFITPPPIGTTFVTLTDTHFITNTFEFNDNMDERVNILISYFNIVAGKEGGEVSDYDRGWGNEDTTLTTNFKDRKPKIMFNRWLRDGSGENIARITISNILRVFGEGQRVIEFELSTSMAELMNIGDQFFANHPMLVDSSGVETNIKFFVTKKVPGAMAGNWKFAAFDTKLTGQVGYYAPDTIPNFTSASDADKQYAFYADAAGLMPDGSPGYVYF